MRVYAERLFFKLPGFCAIQTTIDATPGNADECVELLNAGHIVAISPGGALEGLFGDNRYQLMWKENRYGWAKAAVRAKCVCVSDFVRINLLKINFSLIKPIIPMFSRNCREVIRCNDIPIIREFLRYLFDKFSIKVELVSGVYPVKLVSFVGPMIPYNPDRTPEQLRDHVQ